MLAVTDALLAAKQPLYDECVQRRAVPHHPYVYARRLRCAECGGNIHAYLSQVTPGALPRLRIHWLCQDAMHGGECTAGFGLPQYRLNALLDRALRHLFLAARQQCEANAEPEWNEEAKQKVHCERLRLLARRASTERKRLYTLESYAQGLLTDIPTLKQRLAVLEARINQADPELQELRPVSAAAAAGDQWAWSKLGRL